MTLLIAAGLTSIVTTTATVSYGTVYPNGLHLETLRYPTYVSQYPGLRVSSACSCFLAPGRSTVTVTATGPTAVCSHISSPAF